MVITLPSGREVEVSRPPIAPSSLYIQLVKNHPRPTPPLQEVTIMGKGKEWVENLAHPNYEKEVVQWTRLIQTKMAEKMILLAVRAEPTDSEMVIVDQMRGVLGDIVTNLTDIEVFIFFVLIQSQEDFEAISTTVGELNNPTEAQIANHAERFQRKATGS